MSKILSIYNILNNLAETEIIFLKYSSSFELLIGVILSAQTTDRQVNNILPKLFCTYPRPEDLAAGKLEDIAEIIRPVGFYNSKAEKIKKTAELISRIHNGRVPEDMEALLQLPGVGRKSANVIRGACFGLPAVIVDTHFGRVVKRLELTAAGSPEKIEADLMSTVPENIQYRFSMLINKLGRDFCKSRNPLCTDCPISKYCGWKKEN